MFENIERDEERGQVGIGTLIVFIALVLVAAIAAGVLINTAGFLQSQAESTGQESTQQVSDRVQIGSVIGQDLTAKTDNGQVDTVEVTLTLAPGAGAVDLEDATFEYLATSTTTFPGSGGEVSFSKVTGGGASSVLEDGDDQIVATIDLTASDIGTELDAGDSATLSITTQKGGTSTTEIAIPDPDGLANGNGNDEAVRL
jgi:flagellin FlaB